MANSYNPRTNAIKRIRKEFLGSEVAFTGEVYDKTVGMLAEKQLKIGVNNVGMADVPDGRHAPLELKVHKSKSKALQSLFTKNPSRIIPQILNQFGYRDEKRSRTSFYHTFQNGKSDLFTLKMDRNTFELVPKGKPLVDVEGNPYRLIWNKSDFREIFEQKLERLFSGAGSVVQYGEKSVFRFKKYGIYYQGFKSRAFWNLLKNGQIVIDFRCHVDRDDKIRDHGICFRLDREIMYRLYENNEVIRKT
jgi:hypothetical protein